MLKYFCDHCAVKFTGSFTDAVLAPVITATLFFQSMIFSFKEVGFHHLSNIPAKAKKIFIFSVRKYKAVRHYLNHY
jgi:amino acid permease